MESNRKSIKAEEELGRAFPSLMRYCSSNATPFSLKECSQRYALVPVTWLLPERKANRRAASNINKIIQSFDFPRSRKVRPREVLGIYDGINTRLAYPFAHL